MSQLTGSIAISADNLTTIEATASYGFFCIHIITLFVLYTCFLFYLYRCCTIHQRGTICSSDFVQLFFGCSVRVGYEGFYCILSIVDLYVLFYFYCIFTLICYDLLLMLIEADRRTRGRSEE